LWAAERCYYDGRGLPIAHSRLAPRFLPLYYEIENWNIGKKSRSMAIPCH